MLSIDSGEEGARAREKLKAYRTEMKQAALARKLPI
jgi:hypothetical protein